MTKNLIPFFIQEQYIAKKFHGDFLGYAIFVDISGFTKLTQQLLKKGSPGAEILSNILNATFAPIVKMTYKEGGFIPYFAGDAFTGIFPESKNVREIVGLAQEMIAYFDHQSTFSTQFGQFEVKIKIGISFGVIDWGIIGKQHHAFFFRGQAIDNSAFSQTMAKEQEIVLDFNFKEKIKDDFQIKPISNTPYFLLLKDNEIIKNCTKKIIQKNLLLNVLSKFQPKEVIEFNQKGEFRDVISVFISFKGLKSYPLLHKFGTQVLELFDNHSGYFKEIDFSDKGGVMVGFFGAPVSYENNQERALKFALAVKNEASKYSDQDLRIRIGITEGVAFTGLIGSTERMQYAAIGNRVNLAARLMMQAHWNEVLVDEFIAKNKNFKFHYHGDIQYKGLVGDIPTYELLEEQQTESPFFIGSLVGRSKEFDKMKSFIEQSLKIPYLASVTFLYGEAGLGKSRMSYELKQNFAKENIAWLTCQADQILKKPFNPFIYFLSNYFNQSGKNSLTKNLRNFKFKFDGIVHDLKILNQNEWAKELVRSKSIFQGLLGLETKNTIWNELDAKGRYQNILEALSTLFLSLSLKKALVLELEDGHWFDTDSLNFLKFFIKKMPTFPLAILITSRYSDDGQKPIIIERDRLRDLEIPFLEIELTHLSETNIRALAREKLGGEISDSFAEVLVKASNGNPFYSEQILAYFEENNLLKKVDNVWFIEDEKIELSYSINTILMSRIDRLSAMVKETVKAAAVIGREFDVPVLAEVMKSHQTDASTNVALKTQIDKAERGNIWRAINELKYIFNHALLREAVYNMQLKSRLEKLHNQIGYAIEKLYGDQIDLHLFELVFHFERAHNIEKTKYYLKKAGDFSRRNFQNQQAIRFYSNLLTYYNEHADLESIVITKLKRNKVWELIGDWKTCEKGYQELLKYVDRLDNDMLVARIYNNFGHLLMLQGKYELAEKYLKSAIDIFNIEEDVHGKFIAFGHLGHVYFRQGLYQEAKTYFLKSIDLSKTLPYMFNLTQIVSNLGLTYMNQGFYQEGIDCQLTQLEKAKAAKDKQGMASIYTNLGIVYFESQDYKNALVNYQLGLELSQELKNKHLTAIAIGCIGSVYDKKGNNEKALELYLEDLDLCKELGDIQGISIVHGLIGGIFFQKRNFKKAKQHFKKQFELSEEINYQKGAAKALLSIGKVYLNQKKNKKAIKFLGKAIKQSEKIDYKPVLAEALILSFKIYKKEKKKAKAEKLIPKIQQLLDILGNIELEKLFSEN